MVGFFSSMRKSVAKGPHSQILMTGGRGGGSDRGSYFIPKKITTSKFVYPKKSLLFFACPKYPLVLFSQPKKIPLFFFATQKNPGVFHRPKTITFAKISDPKNHSDPPVINICEWVPWGQLVSMRGHGSIRVALYSQNK